MEKGKVLVEMEIRREGNLLLIGDSPQLIVNLENQENYIKIRDRLLPYYREVALSNDLLEGKRENVLETALDYFYKQACNVAEGIFAAEAYRSKANLTVREWK